MIMKQQRTSFALAIALCFVMWSCSTTPANKETAITPVSDTTVVEKTENSADRPYEMVISDIPFPFEILDNLYQNRIPFNQKVLNNPANASKYSQYNMKALNLGIYGADLSYAVTYEQFQQIGAYIKTTKKLAEELNIPLAFDSGMMDRYNKSKNNKDSLTNIVYDSYTKVDKALKNDERIGMAALVVTGSWLEGLYLSTRTFMDAPKNEENHELYKTIANQKKSLGIVIKLLEEYKQDPYFASLIAELQTITSEYNTITKNQTMNERQLIAINAKVEKLRNRITEGL
jgi:hypothetical protein